MSAVIILPRNIGPVSITCFLYEQHRSEATVTNNPIEDGSSVHDHMYTEAKGLTLEIADEQAANAFIRLVNLQELRKPFRIVTGLSVYEKMVIKSITADRDKATSKILRATVELQEVIIVGTQSTVLANSEELPPTIGPSRDAKTFDQTSPTIQRGDAQTIEIDNDKGSSILADAIL